MEQEQTEDERARGMILGSRFGIDVTFKVRSDWTCLAWLR